MSLVCLDTNAFNNLAWRGDADRIEALQSALRRQDSPHVLIVGTLLEELAPMLLDQLAESPMNRARQMLELLLSGVKVRMLHQPLDRIQAAIDAAIDGRLRPYWSCLRSVKDTRAMLRHHMNNKDTLTAAVQNAEHYEPAINEERSTRLRIFETAPPEFNLADASLEALIELEVQQRLKQGDYRLPADEANWPRSVQLPTLRYFWSIVWTYRWINIAEPQRVEKINDLPDFLTYRDTAYAEVLVTDDRRLRAYIAQSPEPKARVMRFEEWASTVLGQRPTMDTPQSA